MERIRINGLPQQNKRPNTIQLQTNQKRKLKIKYNNLRNKIIQFDLRHIGYSPLKKHSRMQKQFGTTSLHDIKSALKIKQLSSIQNNTRENTIDFRNKKRNHRARLKDTRIKRRIQHIKHHSQFHINNKQFSIPKNKIIYMKAHNILVNKLKIIKHQLMLQRINTHYQKHSHQNKKQKSHKQAHTVSSKDILQDVQNSYKRKKQIQNFKRHHFEHLRPSIPIQKVHAQQTGYQAPRHPQRFNNRGLSI